MDGGFCVPVVAEDGQTITGWTRGDHEVKDANYHRCITTPLRYLRFVDGEVVMISQAEKDALLAADALAEQQASAREVARAEQQRLDDLAAAVAAANTPFNISKRKLRESMYELGRAAEFRAFLAADLKRQEYYDDSQYLESDHPMVVEAVPAFASLLPEGASVTDFLRSCEDR
jgi:hypothetical protein